MPTGRAGGNLRHRPLEVPAQREDVSAVTHGDGEPDGGLAVDAEQRLRGIGIGAPHTCDIAQAQHAAANGKIDARNVLLGQKGAGDPQRERFVARSESCRPA